MPARIVLAVVSALIPVAAAMADAPNLCFDFGHPEKIQPLSTPLPFKPGSPAEDVTASGERPRGGGWAKARALLDLPLRRVIDILRDQTTLKNPKESDLEIKAEKRLGFLDFQTVGITIHPFPLVSVDWTEEWAYRVTAGTEQAPREALVAYQKTAGTSHIKHFCGTISLKAQGTAKTDIAVYEETEASHRSHESIAKGHLGTLRTIREKAALPKPSSGG